MRRIVHDKYFLKDLLCEIRLFDRRIGHLTHHVESNPEVDSKRALRGAITRRGNLTSTARQLISEGISYDHSGLPGSMLSAQQRAERHQRMELKLDPVGAGSPELSDERVLDRNHPNVNSPQIQTPFEKAMARLQDQAKVAGMPVMSWKEELLDYKKRKRNKISA